MSMSVFNHIRIALINPSPAADGKRKELFDRATGAKATSLVIGIAATIFGAIGYHIPYLWIPLVALGTGTAITCHDVYVMADNTERMCVAGMMEKTKMMSVDYFVDTAFKGTWITGSLAGNLVKRELNRPAS